MAQPGLPRILSPNLGCPELVTLRAGGSPGFEVVLALPVNDPDWASCRLRAVPSCPGEGSEVPLDFAPPEELDDDNLPDKFESLSETRRLISTTLRDRILGKGRARFWLLRVSFRDGVDERACRTVEESRRSTLFDLVLSWKGQEVSRARHSLCLRIASDGVRFIHLTDLHVAARNDLWSQEAASIIRPQEQDGPLAFRNWNKQLRAFIARANAMADAGELDFVLIPGDLVDFVHGGISQKDAENWRLLFEIFTGGGQEAQLGNQGFRVPTFTSLGNHDWRFFPYPPETCADAFDLQPSQAEKLDYLYEDSPQAVGRKIAKVHSKLIAEGSPILARSWWRSVVSPGLKWLEVSAQRLWAWILAAVAGYLRTALTVLVAMILGGGGWVSSRSTLPIRLENWLLRLNKFEALLLAIGAITAAALVLAAVRAVGNWLADKLRKTINDLISLEAGVKALRDYFLSFNPYFNYAFQLDDCFFAVLDTGHDVLVAQSFWDNSGKKIGPVSIRDNILGGSPDTTAFYPPNSYYPYSQIAWLERVLTSIQSTTGQMPQGDRCCRVFVALHSPPANLSPGDLERAEIILAQRAEENGILLRRKWWGRFDVRFGTLNHFLSQFYYLCMGYREREPHTTFGPGVDVVLAGHAHWNVEFRLDQPEPVPNATWAPLIYFGKFSAMIEKATKEAPSHWWGPLLLQTAACGPPSAHDPEPPYYRYIKIDGAHRIQNLAPVPITHVHSFRTGQYTVHRD